MRYLRAWIVMALLIMSACNLTSGPPTSEPINNVTDIPSGKPTVTISSPETGSEVVVGDNVLVSANATDAVGVTRMQLIANNQIVKTVSSESISGDKNMSVLLDYKPSAPGDVTLQVIAYRAAVASDPAEVDITVRSNQAQVTATLAPIPNVPDINPNDPTCRALVNIGLNLRSGPGTNYQRITVLGAGTLVPVIGRIGSNQWWQVRSGVNVGWVAAEFTTLYGAYCSTIPIVAPPPSPTTTPSTPTYTPTLFPTNTPISQPPTLTPGPSDLVITSIIGETNVIIPPGSPDISETYTVTITNSGSRGTGQFSNTVQVLPGGPVLDLGVSGNLRAGESISLSISLTFDTPGAYTIRATTDSGAIVDELSEFNNTGTLDINVDFAL
jgi:uncharacterized protein YraI